MMTASEPKITPEVALALRIRQLSTALTGQPTVTRSQFESTQDLTTRLEDALSRLEAVVEAPGCEYIRRFIKQCERAASEIQVVAGGQDVITDLLMYGRRCQCTSAYGPTRSI